MTISFFDSTNRRSELAALAAAAMLAVGASAHAQTGDAKRGAQKAIPCQGCHGLDGLAKLPDAPNLAGQNTIYFVKAMKDYQTGARKDERMSVAVKGLKPDDLEDLAAFYAGLPGAGRP